VAGRDFAGFEHVSDWSDQEAHDPFYADERNFCKVEKWTRDGTKVDSLLCAGNNLRHRISLQRNCQQLGGACGRSIGATPPKSGHR
jgi:hypothetical protein